MTRLKKKYQQKIIPILKKEWHETNSLAIPRLQKIVINMGVKDGAGDKGVMKKIQDYLARLTGQLPLITKARKAEAAFKTRKGDPIGVMATLRGERMYHFFDKLISIVLPRVRDFQGLNRQAFDGRGNYSLGLKEQIVFPELDYDTIDQIRSLQLTIVTNTDNDQKALRLLELLGMPFTKEEKKKNG